ncbi:MAG TPA: hypothetical protein VG245_04120 [Candidatus Dormibacteraeota bacterium]|jgi:hypothetical protein|nr:hypothetical protein [Candidatus Dormibacteraeota bacterium]
MMICPICGEVILQNVIQGEAALVVHRFLKHEPPWVQAIATVGLAGAGWWLFSLAISGKLRLR